jgi:hypothetical protein
MPLSLQATLFATTMLAAFALWTPAASASDKDCGDFATQRAAQIFYLKHGGPRQDPHRLDADDDGVACEANQCPCYRKTHLPRRPALARVDSFPPRNHGNFPG